MNRPLPPRPDPASEPAPEAEEGLGEFLRNNVAVVVLATLAVLAFLSGVIFSTAALIVIGVLFGVAAVITHSFSGTDNSNDRPVATPPGWSTTPVSNEERQQRLQHHLSEDMAFTRGRIESVTPYTAVIVYGRPVNHVLHLLASVFLCGFWIPIWILITISGGERRAVLSVDPCGNVTKR